MERLSTGIEALDLVLGGGLPAGGLTILAGAPGTGKTILAEQICFANATQERKAIYYSTISELPSRLISHLEAFEFFDRSALVNRIEFINLGELLSRSGQLLGDVLDEVVRKSVEQPPRIMVVDSAKALREMSDRLPLRTAVYNLGARLAQTQCTLLFLGEYSEREMAEGPEFSLADGILELAYEPREPIDRRWLRVVKLRNSDHLTGKHPIRISRRGLDVFPRLEAMRPSVDGAVQPQGRISSGTAGLDKMMAGGIPAGDATAILGPSGSGKTALALRFVAQGLEQGERCLCVSFQEDAVQLIKKAASFGWDLAGGHRSGQLLVHYVPQGQLNLDVLGSAVRAALASGDVRRVVLDSLAELVFAARESERFPAYARTLLGLIRAAGATVVVTSETTTLGPMTEPTGGLSFLFHNVVFLRYIEQESEIRRAIGVIKMRDSNHEKGLHQYVIGSQGIEVQERLESLTGLLGWSALREHEP